MGSSSVDKMGFRMRAILCHHASRRRTSRKALRQHHGRGGRVVHGGAGRRARPARAEWCRQVDHRRHARGPLAAGPRQRTHRRCSFGYRRGPYQAPPGSGSPGDRAARRFTGPHESRILRRIVWPRGPSARSARGRRARSHESQRAGTRSAQGIQRRLNIACALLHEPAILLLDEPTVGVDPQSRNAIFETIEALAAAGRTLIYTTHYMEEVERLCDRVVVIDHGRVLADDTLEGVLARAPAANLLSLDYEEAPDSAALSEVAAMPGITRVELTGTRLTVAAADLGSAAPRVLERIAARGFSCRQLTSRRANLEDAFLALTGRTLRDP